MSAAAGARRPGRSAAVARLVRTRRWPDVVMGAGALVAFVLILYVGRHLTTFLYDEWNFVLNRRSWDLHTILRPHNEHLTAVPTLVFKLFFETIGAAPYWPYRVAIALLVVGLGIAVYVFAVPRLGRETALVPGLLTLLIGGGAQDIIWPFQLGFGLSVLGGIVLLSCLDRGTRRAEGIAGVAVAIALASSSVGLAVLACAIVDVSLRPDRRARALRILALPIVLYGGWYAQYHAAQFSRDNLLAAPQYAIDAAGGAVGALLGLPPGYYPILALLFVGLIAWGWLRPEVPPLRLITIISLPFAFWLLTAIGRAHDAQPTASRYLLPGAIFVALALCEVLRGVRFPPRAALLGAVLVLFASWTHVVALRAEARAQFDGFTSHVRAQLAALSLARETGGAIDPAVRPDPVRAPDIVVGTYFETVDDIGDPIPDPVATLATSFVGPRGSADATYFGVLGAAVRPGSSPARGGAPPEVVEGAARPAGSCVVAPGGRKVVVALPRGGLALRTAGPGRADVHLRRWGPEFVQLNGLDRNVWGAVSFGRDRDPTPVQVLIEGKGDVRACVR